MKAETSTRTSAATLTDLRSNRIAAMQAEACDGATAVTSDGLSNSAIATIKVKALRLMGFALVGLLPLQAAHAQTERVFPPPAPLKSPLEGAIDFHVHSDPDVFGRSLSDFDVARLAVRMGMRALVFKNHVTSTADRAVLTMQAVPGIEIFGGVVLNQAVGGVNPAAVEWMYRMSGGRGKVVWLPTFDADNHLKSFKEPGEGLKVAVDGAVTPQTEAVLKIIARENLVLQTGHVSPSEVLAVMKRGRELGLKNMVVTHAMAEVPGLSLAQMKEVAELGGYLELDFLNHLQGERAHQAWMTHWRQVSIKTMADAVRSVGAEHFILATDLGQTGNPTHPDGLAQLIAGLKKEGISQQDVDLMVKKTPAMLLGLQPWASPE